MARPMAQSGLSLGAGSWLGVGLQAGSGGGLRLPGGHGAYLLLHVHKLVPGPEVPPGLHLRIGLTLMAGP